MMFEDYGLKKCVVQVLATVYGTSVSMVVALYLGIVKEILISP